MKTITRHFDGGFVKYSNLPFSMLYNEIKELMPQQARWIVDTGKTKRMYFWFYANEYLGYQLCFTKLPK